LRDLTTGGEAGALVAFSLPMLLGNVFQQFYNMVDSVVVGNLVGKTALAAVGAAFPILMLMISLMMGLTMGATVLIAQQFGAGERDRIRTTINTTYISIFWSGAILSLVGVLATPVILRAMHIPWDVYPEASTYLRILFAGMLGSFGYNTVSAVLRGLGDSRTPLYALIFSTVLNIVLDLLFVAVFRWGVAGVAWATVIAQTASFLAALFYLDKRNAYVRFSFRGLSFDRDTFVLSMKIGLPSGIQQSLVAFGHMLLMRIVNGFGTDAVAGFSAASRVDSFAMMPAMSLGQAVTTFTGQNIGAGRVDRVRKGLRAGLYITLAIAFVMGLAVIHFSGDLMSIFNRDPGVISVGERYILVIGMSYSLFGILFLMNGVFRGAGEAVVPMYSTILALWLVRVPCALWFSSFMGVDGIWWAVPVGWTVGCTFSGLYYASGRWRMKSLVAASPGVRRIGTERTEV